MRQKAWPQASGLHVHDSEDPSCDGLKQKQDDGVYCAFTMPEPLLSKEVGAGVHQAEEDSRVEPSLVLAQCSLEFALNDAAKEELLNERRLIKAHHHKPHR